MVHILIETAMLLLALPACIVAAASSASSDTDNGLEPASTFHHPSDAIQAAPLQQQILYNSTDAHIVMVSAAFPAGCSCKLGVRDIQENSSQPRDVASTELLAKNVIAGSPHTSEYIVDVDCGGTPADAQRCRAQPEQLSIMNMARGAVNGDGAVLTAGGAVIEAAFTVTAGPAVHDDTLEKESSDDLQSGAAAVRACRGSRIVKWTARAALILITAGLTCAAGSA